VIVGVPAEIAPGERRVALVPEAVKTLASSGFQVVVEAGAGRAAGFDDAAYTAAGAKIGDRAAALGADVVVKVQGPRARQDGSHEASDLRKDAVLIGLLRPLDDPQGAARLAQQGVTAFAMELVPRITRAQAMDALSSQSNLAGYRAVLMGAGALTKIFPMMVTAAGTIQPARVFVIGAGVAGLQAIATARRLGAIIEAYDTRPVVKEQVESLGARFVELDLETKDAQDAGGYAKAQSEEFYQKQRRELGKRLAQVDVVVTTALVPGQRAPILIDADAVRGMKRGAVIVDLAAEQGGNCELCDPERTVDVNGVTIVPGRNLASDVPTHASQLYARNLITFLKHLAPKGELVIDLEDEITKGTLLTRQGAIANDRVKASAERP
jgi:NAD(P) transhydrogenase subunit alpha